VVAEFQTLNTYVFYTVLFLPEHYLYACIFVSALNTFTGDTHPVQERPLFLNRSVLYSLKELLYQF